MREASIFNIQRFSTSDGPGIRTTVFLKGCPLRCAWCHNPEGIDAARQLAIDPRKCIGCGACVVICPRQEDSACLLCGRCAEVCPAEARRIMGKTIRVDELMVELDKDRVFFDESGGGVTFSGGEPLAQPDFLIEALKSCRQAGIRTAVDTSGFAPWDVLAEVAGLADLILFDIKHVDNHEHVRLTGVSNEVILANLRLLAKAQANLWLRVPVIPGMNDHTENFAATARLVRELGLCDVYLLPYHSTGQYKYGQLGLTCGMPDVVAPSDATMKTLAGVFRCFGIHAITGG